MFQLKERPSTIEVGMTLESLDAYACSAMPYSDSLISVRREVTLGGINTLL